MRFSHTWFEICAILFILQKCHNSKMFEQQIMLLYKTKSTMCFLSRFFFIVQHLGHECCSNVLIKNISVNLFFNRSLGVSLIFLFFLFFHDLPLLPHAAFIMRLIEVPHLHERTTLLVHMKDAIRQLFFRYTFGNSDQDIHHLTAVRIRNGHHIEKL